jgi:hypothetical protein
MTNSKFRIGLFVALLATLFLCLPGLMAGKGGGNGSSKPDVTATISSGLLLGSDGLDGDSYTSLGADEVFASTTPPELNTWDLNLSDSNLTGRAVSVTFDSNLDYTSGAVPKDGLYSGIVSSRCFTGSSLTVVQFWTITPTTTQTNCSLNISVTYEGVGYLFAMSPEYSSMGSASATVACTNNSTGPCTSWTITGNGPAVLIENYGNAKKAKVLGTAVNSFSIDVSLD